MNKIIVLLIFLITKAISAQTSEIVKVFVLTGLNNKECIEKVNYYNY